MDTGIVQPLNTSWYCNEAQTTTMSVELLRSGYG